MKSILGLVSEMSAEGFICHNRARVFMGPVTFYSSALDPIYIRATITFNTKPASK